MLRQLSSPLIDETHDSMSYDSLQEHKIEFKWPEKLINDEEKQEDTKKTATTLQLPDQDDIEQRFNRIEAALQVAIQPARKNRNKKRCLSMSSLLILWGTFFGISMYLRTVANSARNGMNFDEQECPDYDFINNCKAFNASCDESIVLDWCSRNLERDMSLLKSTALLVVSFVMLAIFPCIHFGIKRDTNQDLPENPLPLSQDIKSEIDYLTQKNKTTLSSAIENSIYDEIMEKFKKDKGEYKQSLKELQKTGAAFFSFAKSYPDHTLTKMAKTVNEYLGCPATSQATMEKLIAKYKL